MIIIVLRTMEIGSGVDTGQRPKGKEMFLAQLLSNAAKPQPLDRLLRISYQKVHVRKYAPVFGTFVCFPSLEIAGG